MLAGMTEWQRSVGGHGRSHGQGEDHEHGRDHGHSHELVVLARLRHLLRPHSHEAADKVDAAMESRAEGIRVLWIALAVLAGTALLQAVSGSVACWATRCTTLLTR